MRALPPALMTLTILFPMIAQSQQPDLVPCESPIEVIQDSLYCWEVIQPITSADSVMLCNQCNFLDNSCGCWHSITSPQWFVFNTGPNPALTTLTVESDLCGPIGNCGNIHVYYHIFSACPEEGGTVLSMPSNAIGSPFINCWEDFGGGVVDIQHYTMSWGGGPSSWNDHPAVNFPGTDYMMQMMLAPDTEYYLAISPSGTCDGAWSWGDICIEIGGPLILEILNEQQATPRPEESNNKTLLRYSDLLNRTLIAPPLSGVYLAHWNDGTVTKCARANFVN